MKEILDEFEKKLKLLEEDFKNELAKIHTGRLGLSMVENYLITIGNKQYSLKQLANISVLGEGAIKIEPFVEEYLSLIEKTLSKANLNFTISREKNHLHLKFSPLTEESKKIFLKTINEKKEKIKIDSRRLRDESLKKIKNLKDQRKIGEDQFFKAKEEIDKLIEKFNKEIEKLYSQKEKEILM